MIASNRTLAYVACLLSLGLVTSAGAKEIQVQMKNSGKEGAMVFEPSFIKASVGDVVTFLPTNPSHNAESIAAMAPKGTAPFKGALNKPTSFTVTKPGLYGIKCAPHFGMGMVALIQAGKVSAADLSAAHAVKMPPLATKRMNAAFAMVK